MSGGVRSIAASLWLCVALGCDPDPLTQLVVVVDSDWDGFERVEIELRGFASEETIDVRPRDGGPLLPRRLAIVHEGGPLGPIGVTARGFASGRRQPVLVEPRTGVHFVHGGTRMLKIELLYPCIGHCERGEACLAGPICVPSDDERAIELIPWTGEVDPRDVVWRVRDGAVLGERDGGGIFPVRDARVDGDGAMPSEDAAGPDGGPVDMPDADATVETDSGPVQATPEFSYAPGNFDPTAPAVAGLAREHIALDCVAPGFDSTDLAFSNWCGPEPTVLVIDQRDGTDAVLLVMDTLDVASGSTLLLTGNRPVIFAVFGDARVSGRIDASARAEQPGPGADRFCESATGSHGANGGSYSGAGGGGGGGFGSPGGGGGRGGNGFTGTTPAAVSGGAVAGNSTISPLRGGCSGGRGGIGSGDSGPGAAGGGGGGAVQISAAGRLEVTGGVLAVGGGGGVGSGAQDGGGGGGSGGAIVLEGSPLAIDGAAVISANGGAGGAGQPTPSGSQTSTPGADGLDSISASPGGEGSDGGGTGGHGAARVADATGGATGDSGVRGAGGGGGGGGVGRIRVNRAGECHLRGVFTPFASVGCTCGACPGYPALGCAPLDGSGRVYYLCPALTWIDARVRCEAADLTLVRIDDAVENALVAEAVAGDTWIGASDAATEGDWRWSDGTAFWSGDEGGAPVSERYSAWASGEPDNAAGSATNADCAAITPDGSWRDRGCSVALPFVCEQP
jgi:hypothetical protein